MAASYEGGQAEPADVAAGDDPYSYRIVLSPPLGRSYATRIAARYGLSLEQLLDMLHQRKVLDDKTDL